MLVRSHITVPGINYPSSWSTKWKLQLILTVPGLLGFIQVQVGANYRGNCETDNYLMVGYPNGGGVWAEF